MVKDIRLRGEGGSRERGWAAGEVGAGSRGPHIVGGIGDSSKGGPVGGSSSVCS